MQKIKIVVAAIIVHNEKYLLAQRAKNDDLFGLWEFPGGKMEPGESDKQTLHRELFEEFSINAEIGDYLCSSFFTHNQDYEMRAYFVHHFIGELIAHEHSQIHWSLKSC